MNIISNSNFTIGYSNMGKVSFKAGYGDDYKNIGEKYRRYDDIDMIIQENQNKINALIEQKNSLTAELISLIETYQKVEGLDKEEIDAKIQTYKAQINEINAEIDDIRSYNMHLWYDHHERN